jgi:hypothetical protein
VRSGATLQTKSVILNQIVKDVSFESAFFKQWYLKIVVTVHNNK